MEKKMEFGLVWSGDPQYQHLSHQWMTALRAGDEYKLSEKGNIYANPTNPVVFTGQLVYLNNE